ncbi:adenylyltransferase/cytidyltransferase family protein [Streptomyces collinus]|uniref:adenylyltransferase/cytidyltransferase family protein n=1 Tax=Streptomyces collinus TaxID=42684 RepID=UPI00362F1AF7
MARTGKVLTLPLGRGIRDHLAHTGATVGLCHGCFDILHHGHVHYLTQAAAQADVLVVSVTAARHIDKGVGRPVFDDQARTAVVAALGMVDYVVLSDAPTAVTVIRELRPDLYFKGAEYRNAADPRLDAERAALADVGGRYVLTDDRVSDSSTRAARILLGAEGR